MTPRLQRPVDSSFRHTVAINSRQELYDPPPSPTRFSRHERSIAPCNHEIKLPFAIALHFPPQAREVTVLFNFISERTVVSRNRRGRSLRSEASKTSCNNLGKLCDIQVRTISIPTKIPNGCLPKTRLTRYHLS
jgi:hypothetical protein